MSTLFLVKDSFAGYTILGAIIFTIGQLFDLLKTLFHCPLATGVNTEKLAVQAAVFLG